MKIHHIIAILAFPPVLDILIALIFAFFSPIGLGLLSPVSAVLISLIFVTLIPLFPLTYSFKKGMIDLYVSERRQRTLFYIIAIASYLAAASIFFSFKAMIMFYLVLSYALIAIAIMTINFKWKISAHAAGISGPMTIIAYVFGWQLLVLHIFTILVMWSRVKTKSHDLMQVIAGAVISSVISIFVFYFFTPF